MKEAADGMVDPWLQLRSSSTERQALFSLDRMVSESPSPGSPTSLCPLGFSLDSTGFCLSHWDKTPLNAEASEHLKEQRGQKESDGWARPLLSPLCFFSGDTRSQP